MSAVASLNPLRLGGTALPPPLLLAAKLVALSFLLRGGLAAMSDLFLPFFAPLRHLGPPALFKAALQLAFCAAALALTLNRHVRLACLALGVNVLLNLVSSQAYVHNNRVYVALFFLLCALYDPRLGLAPLRWQLALIYAGAALNKLLEPDWHSGAFVEAWLPHYLAFYPRLAALLPEGLLSALLSWAAMGVELLLVPLLLVRRLVPVACALGFAYHTSLVALTLGHTFGLFWFALSATYLALLDWPSSLTVHYSAGAAWQRRAHGLLTRLDPERRQRWVAQPEGALQVERESGAGHRGVPALVQLLLFTPAACAAVTVGAAFVTEAIPLLLLPLAVLGYSALRERWSARRRLRAAPARTVGG